jgi:chemotaxis signal transduction protein
VDLSTSSSLLFKNALCKHRTWLIRGLKNLRGVFIMSTDLLQQLLEVDQKAREQERVYLIQNFFNLGVSIEIIAEATSVSVEDVKRIIK